MTLCRVLLSLLGLFALLGKGLSSEKEEAGVSKDGCPHCGSASWLVVTSLAAGQEEPAEGLSSKSVPDTS